MINDEKPIGKRNVEIYFEIEDISALFDRIKKKKLMAKFRKVVGAFDSRLASLMQPIAALKGKKKASG